MIIRKMKRHKHSLISPSYVSKPKTLHLQNLETIQKAALIPMGLLFIEEALLKSLSAFP
ncbi:MAG: hypothetical protein JNG41_06685 [Dialister sp.]|nr:hypothetical protein [Dialister sp.]